MKARRLTPNQRAPNEVSVGVGRMASPVLLPRQRSCACGGTCTPCRAQQGAHTFEHAWTGSVPPIVDEVLASPGIPLDVHTRAHMESRFGHDFGRVRVHHDSKAADSAAAVQARAYTVGQDVVMGNGQFLPGTDRGRGLLAHELTHVVQQSRGGTASGTDPILQRAGFGEVKLAEATQNGELQSSDDLVAGLPAPDCRTRFSQLFWLDAIYHPQRPECCFAQVSLRTDSNRLGVFRADHLIEGQPDCDYGDQRRHDFWIGPWRILDITLTLMTVMNMCGEEETLDLQGQGSVRGEAVPAASPGTNPKPSAVDTQPEHIVEASQGRLGKNHEIRYDSGCDVVSFQPHDRAQPARIFKWDPGQELFVDEQDPRNGKTPGQLEQMAGIVLKEYQDGSWQGSHCGDLPRWAL